MSFRTERSEVKNPSGVTISLKLVGNKAKFSFLPMKLTF
jgi:hypothetical protein